MKMSRRYSTRRASASNALHALTTSALALGGISGSALADSPPEQMQVSYSYSYYSEDGIKSSKLAPGSDDDRYDISMQQFSLLTPLLGRFDLGLDVTYETMSGATPWFVIPDANGDPIQVMSGASGLATEVDDRRTDLLLSSNYYLDNGKLGVSAGFSTEKDYDAFNWGLSGERHFFGKNTTLSGGLVLSYDEIEPTDADLFATRPSKEDKDSITLSTGISQVLTRFSVVQASLSFKNSSGYLSDPYKLAFIENAGTVADSRPDRRNQWALMMRYRHHLQRLSGTMHADYRFAWDDWGIRSHMVELAWHQQLWRNLRIVPSVRYYSQSRADFYAAFYAGTRSDGYYSSDYRLSPYGALTFGIRAETTFRTPWTGQMPWTAAVAIERYLSDGDLALVEVNTENPGLVEWTLMSVSLNTIF